MITYPLLTEVLTKMLYFILTLQYEVALQQLGLKVSPLLFMLHLEPPVKTWGVYTNLIETYIIRIFYIAYY